MQRKFLKPFESIKDPQYTFSIAGKIFILGEYAVLAKKEAIVAAVGPRFTLSTYIHSEKKNSTSEQSPAGRLLAWISKKNIPELSFDFHDPHQGRGGFGASSALFALIYRAYAETQNWSLSWKDVHSFYRDMSFVEEGLPPSGADLVSQWQGGVSYIDLGQFRHENLSSYVDGFQLLVFSATDQAGRKVATHQHLKELEQSKIFNSTSNFMHQLSEVVNSAAKFIRAGDAYGLGSCLDLYASLLNSQGLESQSTHRERLLLRQQKGVLGVKGTGAMQSDAMIVLMDAESDPVAVIQLAQNLGLKLMATKLDVQEGVQWKK